MTTPTMSTVQGEWLRRVEAEYTSAVITQHLTLWLMQIAAPFELARLGLSIVDDELVHAELSQAVYVAAGGNAGARLDRDRLGLKAPRGEPLELSIARVTLEAFCLGETVAVRLFARLRKGCTEPSALCALERIIRDEVKHREFGWTLFEWLMNTPLRERVRQLAERELEAMFARLQASYAFAALGQSRDADPELCRWGLMPRADYAAALVETLERDYTAHFAEHDIDAVAPWQAAVAGAGARASTPSPS